MGWKRVRSVGRRLTPALLLTLALAAGSRDASRGQPVIRIVSNSQIRATVGVSGQTENVTPAVNVAGRFGVYEASTTGLPLLNMAAGIRNQSYVTVRIDGGPPTPGVDADEQTAPGWDLIFGDEGSNGIDASTDNQKDDQGAWIQQPTVVGNNRIVAKWHTLPGGNENFPIPSIEIDLNLTLVHDMVSYEFTIVNRDVASHTVALRFAQDYNVPAASDAPVLTPTTGAIYTETDLTGSLVPPYWRALNTSTGQTVGAQLSTSGVAKPLRVTFGELGSAILPLWTFTPNTAQTISDGGSGAYFFEQQYAPGQQRVVRTFFGKLHSTIDFDTPMAVGVDGPFSLAYDPSKPAGQQLTPNPFTVTAFAQNQSQITLTGLSATISLPAGLALAQGETITKTASTLAPDAATSFTWSVVPTGTASGTLSYTVSFSAGPGSIGKSVVRTIDIPTLPSQGFTAGWQMVSFPYTFDDPSPSVALGLNQMNFDLVRWDQATATYQVVSTLVPGQGYWLRMATGATVNLVGAHPVASASDFEVRLNQGWNQIGDPFLFPVRWADCKVISTDPNDPDRYKPLPLPQASDAMHQWLLPTLYWYDTRTGAYAWSQDFSVDLVPFRGYWVRANKPGLSLLIPKPIGRSAAVRTTRAAGVGTGWSVRLVASADGVTDGFNFLGMRSGAVDGYDVLDVEKPPSPTGGVSVGFLHPEWGGRAGVYAQDLRATSGRKEWTAQVSTGKPNQDVTITWPDISNLPKSHELYIVDPANGRRLAMRQASSLRVRTGSDGVSRLAVVAEPRSGSGAFRIVSWNLVRSRSNGSVTIAVNTTQDASISVRVLNSSGSVLRNLGSRASTGRTATVLWDYRDGKGIAVPSGMYVIEVRGTTPDGQSASVPVPHLVTR